MIKVSIYSLKTIKTWESFIKFAERKHETNQTEIKSAFSKITFILFMMISILLNEFLENHLS